MAPGLITWGRGDESRVIAADSVGFERTFAALIDRACAGDAAARDVILADCRDYLNLLADRSLDRRLRGKCCPSDIVQNTMLNAATGFTTFRGDTVPALKAWLREILRNEVATTNRRFFSASKRDVRREQVSETDSQYFRSRSGIADSMPTPSSEAVLAEDAAELRAAMWRLSADHRDVLLMRNWERLSFTQIGARMNRSENAAKKLWARALAQLEAELFGGEHA